MSGHTPGPWSVGFRDGSGGRYINASNDAIVVVRGDTDDWGVQQGVQRAPDARLIAAAPELLAFAECSAAMDMPYAKGHEILARHGWRRFGISGGEFVAKMRDAAIAKATQP